MKLEVKIAPPNSLLLVMDRDALDIPDSMDGELVSYTPSCVAVGTLSELDGETSVTLTNEPLSACEGDLRKVFSGVLEVQGKEVQVCTALNEVILRLPVSAANTQIAIFANHDVEPTRLCIAADAGP
jgi:hypothetical protein